MIYDSENDLLQARGYDLRAYPYHVNGVYTYIGGHRYVITFRGLTRPILARKDIDFINQFDGQPDYRAEFLDITDVLENHEITAPPSEWTDGERLIVRFALS